MKRFLLIALIIVVLLTAILFCILDKSAPLTKPEIVSMKTLEEESQSNPADVPTAPARAAAGSLPLVTISEVRYEIDYAAWSRELSHPPFEFRGQGTSGWVIDSQGNILINSSEDFGIFGISLSPDKKKILVKGGDGKCLILEPSSHRRIAPPFKPSGSNLFPFMWHWVGPNLIFGISGDEKIPHEGPHYNCCNENNVAKTRFYTFDLLTEQLSEVIMPDAVTEPVVNAVNVMSDGHIHLVQHKPDGSGEQDLGWFKIKELRE